MNAYKHARASEVVVRIEGKDDGYLVQIQDDGVGFGEGVPRSSERGHLGLTSMRERAELQGGWCEISSLPGGGATVRFWLPDPSARFPEAPDDGLLEALSTLADG
jgi:signal transduction histidine kinase